MTKLTSIFEQFFAEAALNEGKKHIQWDNSNKRHHTKAYDAGYKAATVNSKSRQKDNPFNKDSQPILHAKWKEGHRIAKYNNELLSGYRH